MGLATGEAELRDDDYFGTVLNRAARVMGAGHGGQILVADSTAGLFSDADLINLGPRRLRDLPNPITIFQLRHRTFARSFRLYAPSTPAGEICELPPAGSSVVRRRSPKSRL